MGPSDIDFLEREIVKMGPGKDALRDKQLRDWISIIAGTKVVEPEDVRKIDIYEKDLREILDLLNREPALKSWLEETMHATDPSEPVDKPLEQKIRDRVKMLTGELQ